MHLMPSVAEGSGQKSKFDQIYELYLQKMFSLARRILKDDYLAEEAVQLSFEKILHCLPEIEDPRAPQTSSLIYVITKNNAINLYHERKRKEAAPLELCESDLPAPADMCPEAEVENSERYRELMEIIRTLPGRGADILLLRYDNGYSSREIADILDLPLATVQKNLYRAKKKLNQELASRDRRQP